MSSPETIEQIVLRHSARGMTTLAAYMRPDFCTHCACRILDLPRRHILLTTGFYVGSTAETDGPPGTLYTAKALARLGFTPVILTDSSYRGLFDDGSPEITFRYIDRHADHDSLRAILDDYDPCALISIERCGHNKDGAYTNMRGVDISAFTAPIDQLFEIAPPSILKIGVGDGGNEIGMGNVRDILEREIFKNPCCVTCDELIIATTSNWGAFALVAALSILTGTQLLPTFEEVGDYIAMLADRGCVDGISRVPAVSVDGFPLSVEKEISDALQKMVDVHLAEQRL